MVLEIKVGEVLHLKRLHPCGSDRWVVERSGADIGMRCIKCQRRVMVQRSHLERRVKRVVRETSGDS